MKICEFCATENTDDAAHCSSCGGNSFKYKCNNCGNEFKEGNFCPRCGVRIGQKERVCPRCNTKYFSAACPTCGYLPSAAVPVQPMPNSFPAQQAPPRPTPLQPRPMPLQPRPKSHLILWVLGWIFIFPLPLTLILIKKPNMNKGLKYGIIIAAWAVYAVFIIGNSIADQQEQQRSGSAQSTTAVVTEAPSSTNG